MVPLSKRRRRRRRTDGVKTLISIKKAKIRSFQERYLSLKRRIPPTEIHTELLCKNFLLLCRHKAKAPISCLEKNQRRFGKTAVVASFFVSASKERTTPFFQKKEDDTHSRLPEKKEANDRMSLPQKIRPGQKLRENAVGRCIPKIASDRNNPFFSFLCRGREIILPPLH